MPRTWILPAGAILALTGCSTPDWNAVSISPIYGYVDGCTEVTIGGTFFNSDGSAATDVEVTIGGQPLENLTYPDPDAQPLDVGYMVMGTTPAAAGLQKGYADVVVTGGGGQTDTIVDGFYYVACPGEAWPEVVSPETGLSAGMTVSIQGCNLDATRMRLRLTGVGDPSQTATVDFTSVCKTASVKFEAPDLPDDTYTGEIIDTMGNVLYPACYGDPGDTGYYCDYPITLVYGSTTSTTTGTSSK